MEFTASFTPAERTMPLGDWMLNGTPVPTAPRPIPAGSAFVPKSPRNKSLPTARMSFTRRFALTRQPRPVVRNRAAPLALVVARLAWQFGLPFRI